MATQDEVFSPLVLMFDGETLALTPDAFVTQVGLCVANVVTREYIVKPTNYWLMDQRSRNIDPDTVRFWMEQDQTLAKGVFAPTEGNVRTEVWQLAQIVQNLVGSYPGISIWGSPAMFNLPLLTSLFGSKQWKYSKERDMMTLYKLLDPKGTWQPAPNLRQHDAAADAEWQMEYLFNLLALLRENNLIGNEI